METGRDIRLLTLQKQHYLDKYSSSLKSRFSCLGYYDGIDIREVKNEKYSQLFNKQTASPISELWFCAGQVTEELKGGYSCQNIGLFRCVPEGDEELAKCASEFWENIDDAPYFSVGFIKLKDGQSYEEVAWKIETEVRAANDSCCALTYCTYDNADLVVLMQANSISQMTSHLRNIEYNSAVIYFHSILGFSEEYLKACDLSKCVQESYKGKDCFVDDEIGMISVRFATNGSKDSWEEIKKELDRWHYSSEKKFPISSYGNITWAYTLGHGNVQLDIPDTNVRTLLALLIPGGFLTHQNNLYGSYIYNIETYLQVERKKWEEINIQEKKECTNLHDSKMDSVKENDGITQINDKCSKVSEGKQGGEKSWCVKLMGKYRAKMKGLLAGKEDGLYSHFQALVQTLNTLDQYERFSMSREMFCLLYPALQMFDNQLETVLQRQEDYYYNIEAVKSSLGEMIEYVNSVIYHTVHTDQVYLMIPGYSGSSFSIPIKLNLLYLWFIQRIIHALNDSSNEYTSILIPVSESKPMTSIKPLDEKERNRLIRVKISQRFLFMPRPLVIFLCHEIAHYVGEGIRKRQSRMTCMIKATAICIAEGICAGTDNIIINDVNVKKWADEVKEKLKKRFEAYSRTAWVGLDQEDNLYEKNIRIIIEEKVRSFLSSEDEAVKIIGEIPLEYGESLNNQEFVNRMKSLYRVKKQMESNRKQILASGIIDYLINTLLLLFKEVFCDTAAYALLEFTLDDFDEAFRISEGMQLPDTIELPVQWKIRYEMMENLIHTKGGQTGKKSEVEEGIINYNDMESLQEYLKVNVCYFDGIKELLNDYISECDKAIEEYFGERGSSGSQDAKCFRDNREKIKNGFNLFKNDQLTCNEIYKEINCYINEYIKRVEEKINEDCNQKN